MEIKGKATAWINHLEAWQRSGMTQVEYCQTYGLHEKTFSNWKTRLRLFFPDMPKKTRSTIVPPAPAAPFVAVKIDDGAEPAPTQEAAQQHSAAKESGVNLQIGQRFQISLSVGFDVNTLQRLLAVLPEQR